MDPRHQLGKRGEDRVEALFVEQGFNVLARRKRLWGVCEVDLILQRRSKICLVEVKTQQLAAVPELIKEAQLRKLQRLWAIAQLQWGDSEVELVIAWVNPKTLDVEFLRNPC